MTNSFQPGDTKTHRYLVRSEDYADFGPDTGGLVHQVLSTFALGREMEWAARLFVLEMKEADEEGIGTELAIQHHAPAFVGETVVLTATFERLDGANLRCAVEARVGTRLVATGHTGQRIVARVRLAARFAALQAEAGVAPFTSPPAPRQADN
ncbi:MAG TPA: hotdog domain-containing protein [Hymenobacter sp.]|jgi:predicted thioesterase|uniref:thioesterase family protein n=1 Tax=Hymenobacter sp. TaxID=1898978 RepID=UPI002ED7FE34